jgi:rubredoxin
MPSWRRRAWLHGELHGLDAAEVLVGQREQGARQVDGLSLQEGAQLADEGADDVDGLDLELGRHAVDVLAQLRAHDGEHQERALAGAALDHRAGDLLGADAGVQPDLGAGLGELEQRGADHLLRSLTGRIAQHVDVTRLLHALAPFFRSGFSATPKAITRRARRNDEPMKRYRCTVCDHVYDPALGDPDTGIPPGTPFEKLPEDWSCPDCGATKADFEAMD